MVLIGGRHKWGCFNILMAFFTRPWTPIKWANILAQVFLETWLSYEPLEPLIGFLAYLDPKLCHKKQKVVKISTPTNTNLGCKTPRLYMAITRR